MVLLERNIRGQAPVGPSVLLCSADFFSKSGHVNLNEFSSTSMAEIKMVSTIFDCSCLLKPLYHLVQVFKTVFWVTSSLNPKSNNDLIFVAEAFNWNMSVTEKHVLISYEYSTCQLCKIWFENIVAGIVKLLPNGTRLHLNGGSIEVC